MVHESRERPSDIDRPPISVERLRTLTGLRVALLFALVGGVVSLIGWGFPRLYFRLRDRLDGLFGAAFHPDVPLWLMLVAVGTALPLLWWVAVGVYRWALGPLRKASAELEREEPGQKDVDSSLR